MKRILLALTLTPALVACYGSGADDDGTNGTNGTNALSCAPDEFRIEGTLDGAAVSHQGTISGHAWINGGTFDAPFDGGGSFHAEFTEVVADGDSTAIVGNIGLPVSGARGGETVNYASGSLTKRDDGVTFQVTGLAASVTCVTAPCPNEAIEGELSGCVEWVPIGP